MYTLKIELTQIVHGLEYSAVITINGILVFTANIKFGVSIDELDDQEFPADDAKMREFSRSLFQYSIKNGESEIEISDEIFGFLTLVFARLAIDFYNSGQTQDSNEGLFGMLLDRESPLSAILGTKMSIGLTSTCELKDIPSELKAYL